MTFLSFHDTYFPEDLSMVLYGEEGNVEQIIFLYIVENLTYYIRTSLVYYIFLQKLDPPAKKT